MSYNIVFRLSLPFLLYYKKKTLRNRIHNQLDSSFAYPKWPGYEYQLQERVGLPRHRQKHVFMKYWDREEKNSRRWAARLRSWKSCCWRRSSRFMTYGWPSRFILKWPDSWVILRPISPEILREPPAAAGSWRKKRWRKWLLGTRWRKSIPQRTSSSTSRSTRISESPIMKRSENFRSASARTCLQWRRSVRDSGWPGFEKSKWLLFPPERDVHFSRFKQAGCGTPRRPPKTKLLSAGPTHSWETMWACALDRT